MPTKLIGTVRTPQRVGSLRVLLLRSGEWGQDGRVVRTYPQPVTILHSGLRLSLSADDALALMEWLEANRETIETVAQK